MPISMMIKKYWEDMSREAKSGLSAYCKFTKPLLSKPASLRERNKAEACANEEVAEHEGDKPPHFIIA